MTKKPPFRKLRGYAFDPSLSLKMDTVLINEITYKVPWEDGPDDLKPGPIGEYLEVVDYDPTVEKLYAPVNLDDKYVLAQDGLAPSASNPQFHQQMVYAVVMTTIKNFETGLGRPVLWSPHSVVVNKPPSNGKKKNGNEDESPFWQENYTADKLHPQGNRWTRAAAKNGYTGRVCEIVYSSQKC